MPAYEARLGYSTEPPFSLGVAIVPDIGASALSRMIEAAKKYFYPCEVGIDVALDDNAVTNRINVICFHIDVSEDVTNEGWNLDEEVAAEIIQRRGIIDKQIIRNAITEAFNSSGDNYDIYPNFFYGHPTQFLYKSHEIAN